MIFIPYGLLRLYQKYLPPFLERVINIFICFESLHLCQEAFKTPTHFPFTFLGLVDSRPCHTPILNIYTYCFPLQTRPGACEESSWKKQSCPVPGRGGPWWAWWKCRGLGSNVDQRRIPPLILSQGTKYYLENQNIYVRRNKPLLSFSFSTSFPFY